MPAIVPSIFEKNSDVLYRVYCEFDPRRLLDSLFEYKRSLKKKSDSIKLTCLTNYFLNHATKNVVLYCIVLFSSANS